MERPIIGVIPLWDEKKDSIWMLPGYMQGLEEAGAIPAILNLTVSEPVLKQIACFFDGFLFITGGEDVDPKLYGQEKADYCGETCEMRDRMEAYIFREAVLNQNKPALGICRGIQLINVLPGGSLYQDIHTELPSKIKGINTAGQSPAPGAYLRFKRRRLSAAEPRGIKPFFVPPRSVMRKQAFARLSLVVQ